MAGTYWAASERERAIQAMAKNLSISCRQKSNVIAVGYRARSPKQAQAIVSTLVDEYLTEHQRIHATPGSYDFFFDQAKLFSDEVSSAQQKLTQRRGLEWLFRLLSEPRRLGKRYLTTNMIFAYRFARQWFGLYSPAVLTGFSSGPEDQTT